MTTPISLQELKDASADALSLEQFVNNPSGNVTARLGAVYPTAAQAAANVAGLIYRGAWATSTTYALRDLSQQGGIVYVCIVGHVSGTFATDLAAGRWAIYQGATKNGTETLSNKSFSGAVSFFTNSSRIGITSKATALSPVRALVHIENDNTVTNGLLVTSSWVGTTASPYTNNDTSLFETYNSTLSNSANRSWSGSFPNAYHNIPLGVTDSGDRQGVIGWATSVPGKVGYVHSGTLEQQTGVTGVAGFQGSGTPSTAVVNNATGVRGFIYSDSTGATIGAARAGEFISTGSVGVVQNNIAVYAAAQYGTNYNYSFYGALGKFINFDQALFGATFAETTAYIAARSPRNAVEFGFPSAGHGSNLGSTPSAGYPFLGLCCEAEATGNTYRTRGRKGTVILNDLAGAMVFGQVTNANAAGQTMLERLRISDAGQLTMQETVVLKNKTPASATAAGVQGEFAWDSSYLYICVATNTWKRVAVASW